MYLPTEILLEIADEVGLVWTFSNLLPTIGGFYDSGVALIDKSIKYDSPEFRCFFAEELSHFLIAPNNPFAVDSSYIGRILDQKIEKLALKHAVNLLIDTDSFIKLYNSFSDCSAEGTIWRLSQYFRVISDFTKFKLYFLEEVGDNLERIYKETREGILANSHPSWSRPENKRIQL